MKALARLRRKYTIANTKCGKLMLKYFNSSHNSTKKKTFKPTYLITLDTRKIAVIIFIHEISIIIIFIHSQSFININNILMLTFTYSHTPKKFNNHQ